MAKNKNLHAAKKAKNDEFYTQMTDIENELRHYKKHFKGKTIFMNCDDPTESNFWKYFHLNFEFFGLKKIIATHYLENQKSYMLEYEGGNDVDTSVGIKNNLEEDGDFRSEESINLLKRSDIVVTNPPFSCYSSDTEVLTDKGWKYFKDVDIKKDLIFSLNKDTKEMTYVKAIDKLEQDYKGPMYNFKRRGMDLLVTPNHKMYSYYKTSKGDFKPNDFINAENIKKSHLHPLIGYKYEHNLRKDVEFRLPETTQLEQFSRKEITVPEKKIDMGDWLEFFGFYLADGCYRDHINTLGKRDYTISIAQNEENLDYVLELIEKIGFKPKYALKQKGRKCYNISIYSKQLWLHLKQFGRSKDKFIPREFLNLPKLYLKRLLKGFVNGDSQNGKNYLIITSRSKNLIQSLQEIILKVYGQITAFNEDKGKYKNEEYIMYELTVNKKNISRNNIKYGEPEIIDYNDKIYCLTLEKNNIMLVRRNHQISFSGNCFREYIAQLIEYNKNFIIMGNQNAITYKEIFPLIKENKVWLGVNTNKTMEFKVPDNYDHTKNGRIDENGNKYVKVPAISWFTNLEHYKRNEEIILWKSYNEEDNPKYDNYDAIEVSKVKEIPEDYFGAMGVPITFLNKYNPNQFEIIKFRKGDDGKDLVINGKSPYFRILIKRKDQN